MKEISSGFKRCETNRVFCKTLRAGTMNAILDFPYKIKADCVLLNMKN